MSDATNKLRDYLAKSPSVVYPEDVLAYLPAIEAENVRLRERVDAAHMSRLLTENENERLLKLLQRTWDAFHDATAHEFVSVKNELRELGIEVDQ